MYTADDFINAPGFYNREIKNAVAILAEKRGKTVEQINKTMIRSEPTRAKVHNILADIAEKEAARWNAKSA